MTATQDRMEAQGSRWLDRLARVRLVLATSALVFAGLWLTGTLAALPAFVAFALIAIASLAVGADSGRRAAGSEDAPAPREREPLIEAVLAGLPDPAVALDARSDVVAFNAQALALAPALRSGGPVSLALRVPEVLDAIRRAQASHGIERAEFFQRVPQERWYEAIVTPIAARAATPDLLLLALHDLSPLRRVEEMRADFIANASHELRTPLAALSGFIDTLKGPARDDAAARVRFLDIMQGQANRMARLIDDLLSLSRIELNAHLRPDRDIDLAAIVRQVVDGLQTLARDRSVAVEVSPARVREPARECAQICRLRQARRGRARNGRYSGRQARGACGGARSWSRDCAGASAAVDRALLPRGRGGQPRAGRHRPGPRAGQAHSQPPRRAAHHREHARPGRHVHRASASGVGWVDARESGRKPIAVPWPGELMGFASLNPSYEVPCHPTVIEAS